MVTGSHVIRYVGTAERELLPVYLIVLAPVRLSNFYVSVLGDFWDLEFESAQLEFGAQLAQLEFGELEFTICLRVFT